MYQYNRIKTASDTADLHKFIGGWVTRHFQAPLNSALQATDVSVRGELDGARHGLVYFSIFHENTLIDSDATCYLDISITGNEDSLRLTFVLGNDEVHARSLKELLPKALKLIMNLDLEQTTL